MFDQSDCRLADLEFSLRYGFFFAIQLSILPLQAFEARAISFEKNQGQAPDAVQYLTRIPGGQVFLTSRDIVFAAPGSDPVSLRFPGSTAPMRWEPVEQAHDTISYFLGSDPSRWVKNAPVYRRILCRDLYPGVDAIFYANQSQLEYDLIIAPGADASRIRVAWSGGVEAQGNIVAGPLRQHPPRLYQTTRDGEQKTVAGRFVSTGARGEFRLALGAFDAAKPLVVDPVLEMFTYVGGEGDEEIVAVGPGYVVGNTNSIIFPGAQVERRRSRDVFVRGTGAISSVANARALVGTVIFGGFDDDEAAGAALVDDRSPSIQVVGTTRRDAAEPGYHGGRSDGFLATVTSSDRGLSLGRYVFLGGSGEDRLNAVSVSPFRAYAAVGVTDSADLPTNGAPQQQPGGKQDAFYVLDNGFGPIYGYVGGSGEDAATAVAWVTVNDILLGGETRSLDLPMKSESSPEPGAGSNAFFALISRVIDAETLDRYSFTTWYLGGAGDDRIDALTCTATSPTDVSPAPIRLVGTPCAFVGTTSSPDLPVINAAQGKWAGGSDIFIGTLDLAAKMPLSLTYWGGSGEDTAKAIAMNWAGDLFVAGATRSTDFPLSDAFQPQPGGGEDGFFALFERNGRVRHSTYFGGAGDDRVNGVGVVGSSIARLVGGTTSTNLPDVKTGQARAAGREGFIAELGTAYLIGPDEVIVPQDGSVTLSLRSTLVPSALVTYRSSDPTRLQLGTGSAEVTAMVENNVRLEALAGDGEAEVIATAAGFPEKRIRVRFYPSTFLVGGIVTPMSRWSGPVTNWFPTVRAVDPATGKLVGTVAGLRSGLADQPIRWISSDPEVIRVTSSFPGSVTAQVGREGTTSISYEVGTVRSQPFAVSVEAPVLARREATTGENLISTFSPVFTFTGALTIPTRGNMTYRSEDPTRLLVSSDGAAGREAVTLPLPTQGQVYLHGLASEGTVRLIVTSTEFSGERVIDVRLESPVIRMYLSSTEGGSTVQVGNTGNIVFQLGTRTGKDQLMRLRPGVAPLVLKLESSEPRVLELNRLTATVPSNTSYTVRGVTEGTSYLRLSSASKVGIETPELAVAVTGLKYTPVPPALPAQVVVGKDLQKTIQFRYFQPAGQPVAQISVDDPSLAVVTATANENGGGQTAATARSDEYTFWIQGLRDQGETRLRVRLGTEAEQVMRVILARSAIGAINLQPGSGRFDIGPLSVEDRTGAGLEFQGLRPGVRAQVSLRVEGAAVALTPSSLALDNQRSSGTVTYQPVTAKTDLVIDAPGFTASPLVSRVALTLGPTTNLAWLSASPVAAYRAMMALEIVPLAGVTWPLRVTSLTPDVLLVSTSLDSPGGETISVASGGKFYVQGLRVGAMGRVRVEGASSMPLELPVLVYPLRAERNTSSTILEGQTGIHRLYLTAGPSLGVVRQAWVPKGAPPLRFAVRSANSEYLSVSSSTLEIREGQQEAAVTLTGIAAGTTELVTEPPAEVEIAAIRTPVVVRKAALSVAGLTNGQVSVGRNLQAEVRVTVEQRELTGVARVTSGDASRLLIAPLSSTPGSASTTVNAQNGQLQPFYLQALEGSGEVEVRVSLEGHSELVFTASLRPSWLRGAPTLVNLIPGEKANVSVEPAFESMTGNVVAGRLRAGAGSIRFNVRATREGVIGGLPASLQLNAESRATFEVSGTAKGETSLIFEGTPLFALAPPDDSTRIVVGESSPSSINTSCAAIPLGRDAQVECTLAGYSNVTIRSEDPTKVLVSADGAQVGKGEITGVRDRFFLQGLAAVGTTELVLSAPGYAETRIAVAHRPMFLSRENSSSADAEIVLPRGTNLAFGLTLLLTPPYGEMPPRAGLQLPVTLAVDNTSVVKVEPAALTFGPARASRTFTVQTLAPGTAKIRISAPGYPESTLSVRVNP